METRTCSSLASPIRPVTPLVASLALLAGLLGSPGLATAAPDVAAAPGQCSIAVDGDATAAQVRQELLTFPAAGQESCIPLAVACSQQEEQVVVDFTDELGRHVERRFDTPAGAAAFLISWSRRPVVTAVEAEPLARFRRWQPAAAISVMRMQGVGAGFGLVSLAVTRHDSGAPTHRYLGLGARYGWTSSFEDVADVALLYGVVRTTPRFAQRLEASAGAGRVTAPTYFEDVGDTMVGFRAGLRAAFGVELIDDLSIEASAGVDLLIAGKNRMVDAFPEVLGFDTPLSVHLGVALQWAANR
jgi:hypothetical protein